MLCATPAKGAIGACAGKTTHIAAAGGASVTIEVMQVDHGKVTVYASGKSFVEPSSCKYEVPACNCWI